MSGAPVSDPDLVAMVNMLLESRKALMDQETEMEEKNAAVAAPFRKELAALFKQRQPHLDKIENFWGAVLCSPESPVVALMNATCDSRIARAVTSLSVDYGDSADGETRTVSVTLGKNLFIAAGTYSRTQLRSTGDHVSNVPIKWLPGTEKQRDSSFFNFFSGSDATAESDQHFDSIDELFQNPAMFLEDDEEDEEGH